MAELFFKSISAISRHIANVFAEHELEEKSNLHFLQIGNSNKPERCEPKQKRRGLSPLYFIQKKNGRPTRERPIIKITGYRS